MFFERGQGRGARSPQKLTIAAAQVKPILPMPEFIIVSSPGFIPVTEEEKADIQKLNKVDIMVDSKSSRASQRLK